MRKLYFSIFTLLALQAQAQIINFPDANFKTKLLEADVSNSLAQDVNGNNIKIDANNDGEIDQAEALLVYQLFYTASPPPRPGLTTTSGSRTVLSGNISDATGIGYFIKLRKLGLSDNFLTSLDLTGLNYLEYLNCSHNDLVSINLNGLVNLIDLDCQQNNLETLYLGSLFNLRFLKCNENALTELDVSNLTNLFAINCSSNSISNLQFGGNEDLEQVTCQLNLLTTIDVSDTAVKVLYCDENPNLTSIIIKNGVDSPFDFEMPPIPFPVQSFGFTGLPMLTTVCVDPNEVAVMQQVLASQPQVTISTDCVPQIVNIPDANFKNRLLNTFCASITEGANYTTYNNKVDTNLDGEIQLSEALVVKGLKIDTSVITTTGDIFDLEGIQYFTNLQRLNCGGNQIQNLDVTMMSDLIELNCQNNAITSIDFSGLDNLDLVRCYNNLIGNLTLTDLPQLRFLQCAENNLTSLDVTALPSLAAFDCSSNAITNLQVHDMPLLHEIVASNNQLAAINFSGSENIGALNLNGNLFTAFDLTPLPNLGTLAISDNAISELDVSGHATLSTLAIENTLIATIDCSQSSVLQLLCSNNPNLSSINVRNGVVTFSDPDMLYYGFRFENLPALVSICIDDDPTERNSVALTPYNSSGNVIVYTGPDCTTEVVMATNEFDLEAGLTLYPNPASDAINIETTLSGSKTIRIYNTLGQLVQTEQFNQALSIRINTSQLKTGTYFIEVAGDQGKSTQKFIKL